MAARLVSDPIENPRWRELVSRHPAASIFHTPGWLKALRETYDYEPFAVTTSEGDLMDNGLVACRVKGWRSSRVVSLPFSDHCDPLIVDAVQLDESVEFLLAHGRRIGATSVEMRPTFELEPRGATGLQPAARYWFHRIDLRLSEAELLGRLHPSNTRRAIRRAERDGVRYQAGTSDELVAQFHGLVRMTRRRHGLPPQPLAWFLSLVANVGDGVSIHLAYKDGRAIAGMMTLSFKSTMYYKYGGSDASQHRLGGMPFLFWHVIRDARRRGFTTLDLGRSDLDHSGLIAFKEHLGAERSALTYYRHPRQPDTARRQWITRAARGTFARLPDVALDLAGKLIYKRLG